ncbi:MAG: hypothetical protein MZU84_06420 [Sphingobacterium sp.]|nr:hypothetical protein [Sphingobacterium sp.]
MLCTIELDRSRPIAEAPSSASFVRDIEDWSRDLRQPLSLGLHGQLLAPRLALPQPARARSPTSGSSSTTASASISSRPTPGPGHEWSELKSYLLARLLWDPKADVDAVDRTSSSTAITARPAATSGATSTPCTTRSSAPGRGSTSTSRRPSTPRTISRPPTSPSTTGCSTRPRPPRPAIRAVLARVRTARLPLMYAELEIGKDDMFGPRGFYEEKGGRFDARPDMVRLLEEFAARCRAGGVRTLNEVGPDARAPIATPSGGSSTSRSRATWPSAGRSRPTRRRPRSTPGATSPS